MLLVLANRRGLLANPSMMVGGPTRASAGAIREQRFAIGNYWTWIYRDAEGKPSSWERYTVIDASQTSLTMEMATKFQDDEPFVSHHRLDVDLASALAARDDRKQWQMRSFAFKDADDGTWRTAPHRDNVQVFEEKFDVFSMQPLPGPRATATRTREVTALGGRAVCSQSRRHCYTNAWYVREPRRLAGTAAFKSFGPEGGSESFTFELISTGSDPLAADVGRPSDSFA